MKRLHGGAFLRWQERRQREAIEHALDILREPYAPFSDVLSRGFQRWNRAERATNVLNAYLDLEERVRGENGGQDD